MSKITYTDKEYIYKNDSIPEINKITDVNMNEIKRVVNENDTRLTTGWYKTGISPTFTYSSWDSSVYTGVVNSNLDLTPYLSVGMKVKFTQNSAIKYAFITAITSTQITLFLGTDYSLNNSAISNSYYSMLKTPYGFPLNPDKWSVVYFNTTNIGPTALTANVWANPGSSIAIPIGLWKVN